jgi:hypothetical protein
MLTETLLRIPFCDWSMFSSADLSLAAGKINSSEAASGMILQNHRRLPVRIFSVKTATLVSLKRVTGRICNFEGAR